MSQKFAATHELFINQNGTVTLQHKGSGETMHSKIGPETETLELYITQSRLADRLAQSQSEPLVVFDVGLGAGSNALAALQVAIKQVAERRGQHRPLHVYSFETDLTGFELALQNNERFPFFSGLENAAFEVLKNRFWKQPDGSLEWHLLEGSFLTTVADCPRPDVVFFDFYSPKVNPELWGIETFRKLLNLKHTAQAYSEKQIDLYTYCASTRVRVAMLLAGFFVGYGKPTQAKRDTTCASTNLSVLELPLGLPWIEQVRKSHLPFPFDCESLQEKDLLVKALLSHSQFLGG